jgi:glucosylceramidase
MNQDGNTVTVVMNQSDLEIKYKLYVGTTSAVDVVIPAHAIQSLVY